MPAPKASDNTATPSEEPKPDIYMVEDDADLIVEMAELIRRFGFDVMTFTAPSAALAEIAGADRPFIVVTDVMMPELTGHALVREIESTDGAKFPHEVIMVSGESGFDEAVNAMSLGVMDFLPKPVDGKRLRNVLDRAVERINEKVNRTSSQSTLAAGLKELQSMTDRLTRALRPGSAAEAAAPSSGGAEADNIMPFSPRLTALADKASAVARGEVAESTPNLMAPKMMERPAPVHDLDPLADDHCLLASIKLVQNMRRVRDRLFPDCADGDPSFDILLYVEEQSLLGRPVSVTSACHAALIPQTTAMRKIDELVAHGLLVRGPDPRDKRRILLQPAPGADESLRLYLAGAMEQIYGAFEFGRKSYEPHRDAAE
ncbi:MAG: response regulator [Alphaproteobacteria bacterium]